MGVIDILAWGNIGCVWEKVALYLVLFFGHFLHVLS